MLDINLLHRIHFQQRRRDSLCRGFDQYNAFPNLSDSFQGVTIVQKVTGIKGEAGVAINMISYAESIAVYMQNPSTVLQFGEGMGSGAASGAASRASIATGAASGMAMGVANTPATRARRTIAENCIVLEGNSRELIDLKV